MTHPSPGLLGLGLLFTLSLTLLPACGAAPDDPPPVGSEGSLPTSGLPTCGEDEGCPCPTPGETVECKVYRTSGSYVSCSIGQRLCGDDHKWLGCTGGDQAAGDGGQS